MKKKLDFVTENCLGDIFTYESEVSSLEEKKEASEELIKISTTIIDKAIKKYFAGTFETGEINKNEKMLYNMYYVDKRDNIEELTTLDCIYDLKQDCLLYLFSSVIKKFDVTKNVPFKVYLEQEIKGFLQRTYHKKYRTISLPSSCIKRYSKNNKIKDKIKDEDRVHLEEIKPLLQNPYIFDQSKYNKRTINKIETSIDISAVRDILKTSLTEKEYRILNLHFNQGYNIQEISIIQNCTKQNISNTLTRIKEKLKLNKELERMWN